MQAIWEIVFSGLLLGMVYGLGALGMSMIFGVMGILNLAHGAIMLVGGVSAWILTSAGVPYWLALGAGAGVGFLAGLLIWLAHPTGSGSTELLVTLGFALVLEDLILRWGPQGIYALNLESRVLQFLGVRFMLFKVLILALTVGFFLVSQWVLQATDFGLKVRSCIQERVAAVLLGVAFVPTARRVFLLGSLLAGLAGGLYVGVYPLTVSMSIPLTVKALLIVVLGGAGRIGATLGGALFLGLTEVMIGRLASTEWQVLAPYLGLVLALLWRPGGLGSRRGHPG